MAVAQQANTILAMKAQSALGTPASGASAFGLEVRQSQGLAMQAAQIRSQMIQRSRMSKRPRQGSRSSSAAYETELQVDNMLSVFQGVLGGTWAAAASYSNTDWGEVTITGTGTIATFASGTLVTDGVRAGMFLKFTNLSVGANNSLWVPILTVTEGVATFPSGILADNASDAAWNATVAASLYTATPYTDRYFTIEEYYDIDRTKRGNDMKFNALNFGVSPDQPVSVGFGLGGRDIELLASGASPIFSSPVFNDSPSLVLLDGGIYINGTKRTAITGLTGGISAPVSTIPIVGSVLSPDVMLGQFDFAGNVSVAVEDAADFDLMDAETQISLLLFCQEQGAIGTQDFVSIYMGNLIYAGYQTPVGGDGAVIATLPLLGGEDERGTGYAPSTFVISTSAALPS